MTCIACSGRRVDYSRGYPQMCPVCLGAGRTSMPRALAQPGLVIRAAAIGAGTWMLIVAVLLAASGK